MSISSEISRLSREVSQLEREKKQYIEIRNKLHIIETSINTGEKNINSAKTFLNDEYSGSKQVSKMNKKIETIKGYHQEVKTLKNQFANDINNKISNITYQINRKKTRIRNLRAQLNLNSSNLNKEQVK